MPVAARCRTVVGGAGWVVAPLSLTNFGGAIDPPRIKISGGASDPPHSQIGGGASDPQADLFGEGCCGSPRLGVERWLLWLVDSAELSRSCLGLTFCIAVTLLLCNASYPCL